MENRSFIQSFLSILSQSKILHWQTESYSEHEALNQYYNSMNDLIDNFVEVYQGKYGREFLYYSDYIEYIELKDYESGSLSTFAATIINFLTGLYETFEHHSDLCNLIDEMKSCTEKLKYLITLS